MSQSIDQLIFAKWIFTADHNSEVLENYGIAIHDGKIIDVDQHENLKSNYSAKQEFNLTEHILVPGFINAHTHAAMNLLKGYANDLPLMTWLEQHIWPAEGKWMSDEFVYQGTKLAIAEMLKGGTTCFNDMYFMPHQTAEAALDTGIRTNVGLTVLDFPTKWGKDADDYITKGLEVYDQYKHHPTINFSFAPHAPYTVSDEPLKKIATLASQLDLTIQMHMHETQHEVTEALKNTGQRPLARLHQLGLLSPRFQAVHMTALDEQDIELAANEGIHLIHCPESNMKLASGICPIDAVNQAGINIALGTDGSASNNDLDMIGEMRSAALLAKVGSGKADCFSAKQVLAAATLGGAKALGIDELCGSIEQGKFADLCAVDLSHIATQPVFDPVSQLVYSASRDQVSHVWTSGKLQVENFKLKHIDENECRSIADHWREKLKN
ncbi:MAG: TRZ/ATZ family hydrolase [Gammaproteobacteria bacterium]|nr:TRZ/ATZ family hydrolase [Gammaproteobacteria bacterium]